LRGVSGPLQATWINQKLDSRVRATIHSMYGQVDAIGQISSGPTIGLIANVLSVRLAMTISALLLTPALFFIRRVNAQAPSEADTIAEPVSAD
jgi:DHA3 family tetracycline resistance protein-like MFS transporter